jgi:autotransporter translocation and assembly factor TamB
VELSAKLDAQPDGRLVVQSFDLTSPLIALKGNAGYQPSAEAGDGKIAIDFPDLAPLSGLAGTEIGGRGHLDLDLATKTQASRVTWRGTLDDLRVPNMPPDLQHQTVKLSGAAALQRDGSWQLDGVRVGTEGLSFTVSGQGQDQTGALNLSLDLPRLGLLQAGMSGAASAKGKVTLKPNGGDVHLKAKRHGAACPPRAISPASRSPFRGTFHATPMAGCRCRPFRGAGPAPRSMSKTSPSRLAVPPAADSSR